MQFYIDGNTIIIEHNGEKLPFDISCYSKKANEETDGDKNICFYINQYFDELYKVNPNIIDATFHTYLQLREIFDDYTISSIEELIKIIKPYVNNLLTELHKLSNVRGFIDYNSSIKVPSKIDIKFTPNDLIPNSREKTYTRSDYKALLSFSLQLRLMIPIWGEFIKNIKKDEINTKKEMRALTFIYNTDCYNTIFSDSEECKSVIDKLFSYINSHVKEEDLNLALVVKNQIPSADYIDYLLSKIIVTRLCVGDLNSSDTDVNLISLIFNYLTSLVETDAKSNKILEKNFTSQSGENTPSKLEEYKTKQSISIGDIEINKYFLNNIDLVARKLCSTMENSYDGVNRTLDVILENTYKHLELQNIEKIQTDITFAVLATSKKNDNKILISPRIMPYLEKKILINAMSIASTWLWNNNHKVLALLITSRTYNENNLISGSSSRERINSEYEECLNQIYKYSIIRGKSKNNKNMAIDWIEKTEKELSKNVWQAPSYIGHKYILEEAGIDWRNPMLSVPSNIKNLLAKLIIDLDKFSTKLN